MAITETNGQIKELAKFHTIVTDNSLKYDVKIIVRSTTLLSKKVACYTTTEGCSTMLLLKEEVCYGII